MAVCARIDRMAAVLKETRVAPGLLIAMPQLLDPSFHRAVVLMVEHHQEGSFGLVMNRPGSIPVAALVRGFEVKWSGDPDAKVGFGGPVMMESGWIVHEPESGAEPAPGTIAIAPGVVLSTSADTLRRLAEKPPRRIRFLMGYAGWGKGQLASEIVRGSWLHADVDPKLLFETAPDAMWLAALRSIGVDPLTVMPTHGVN